MNLPPHSRTADSDFDAMAAASAAVATHDRIALLDEPVSVPAALETSASFVAAEQGLLGVLIVGGGFSGIGMAIRLRQEGRRDFVVCDKAAGIGGTWWVNRYPGAACDIPSHLYSFSFAPKSDWSHRFPVNPKSATI